MSSFSCVLSIYFVFTQVSRSQLKIIFHKLFLLLYLFSFSFHISSVQTKHWRSLRWALVVCRLHQRYVLHLCFRPRADTMYFCAFCSFSTASSWILAVHERSSHASPSTRNGATIFNSMGNQRKSCASRSVYCVHVLRKFFFFLSARDVPNELVPYRFHGGNYGRYFDVVYTRSGPFFVEDNFLPGNRSLANTPCTYQMHSFIFGHSALSERVTVPPALSL